MKISGEYLQNVKSCFGEKNLITGRRSITSRRNHHQRRNCLPLGLISFPWSKIGNDNVRGPPSPSSTFQTMFACLKKSLKGHFLNPRRSTPPSIKQQPERGLRTFKNPKINKRNLLPGWPSPSGTLGPPRNRHHHLFWKIWIPSVFLRTNWTHTQTSVGM